MNCNITRSAFGAFFCAVASCLIFNAASAQQPNWDSSYRPDIYPLQVALFRSAAHSPKDIVFLGNSITFWGAWPELLRSEHVKNRGIPGDITFGVLDRLDEAIAGKPSKIFVLIGINDIARNIPDSIILQNFKRIVQFIRSSSPKTKIYLQSILPTNGSFGKLKTHYNKEEHIININTGIKRLASEEQIVFVDLYSIFVDTEGQLRKNLSFDGVHLNKDGYDKWVALLRSKHYINQ